MSQTSPKMPVSPKSLSPSEMELKRGPAMKKQSRLHNYVPVTLVLTASSLQYYHNNQANKPACIIPLSAVISVDIVSDPSISVYHGISVDSSFTVFIGDRSFKFRVDNAITAKLWLDMILQAKEKQSADAGMNNPLFITNTDGDNTDGTKFWRSKPIGYVENFSAAIGSISAALPAAVVRIKSVKVREASGLSRKQVEALLTFERVICLSESISKYTAEAFFDCCITLSRAHVNDKPLIDDHNNTSQLLGNSIVHWLSIADHCHSPRIVETRTESLSPSPTIRSSASSPCFPSHCPPRSVMLRQWIESCVMREFRRFSSPEITTKGTLKHTKMPFRSGSIMGQFAT
jgi:hypothetical protein